jgi:hypothetical protein
MLSSTLGTPFVSSVRYPATSPRTSLTSGKKAVIFSVSPKLSIIFRVEEPGSDVLK